MLPYMLCILVIAGVFFLSILVGLLCEDMD
jgi:hypothetical protein